MWIHFLRRSALSHHCAPHSFSHSVLDSLSATAIRRMACHEARFEHHILAQAEPYADRLDVQLSPVTAEAQFELTVSEGETICDVRLLAGGRWVYGEVEQSDRRKAAVCWDLAQLSLPGSPSRTLSPVARIATAQPQMGNAWPIDLDYDSTLRIQFDPKEHVVNHLFAYSPVRKTLEGSRTGRDDWEGYAFSHLLSTVTTAHGTSLKGTRRDFRDCSVTVGPEWRPVVRAKGRPPYDQTQSTSTRRFPRLSRTLFGRRSSLRRDYGRCAHLGLEEELFCVR